METDSTDQPNRTTTPEATDHQEFGVPVGQDSYGTLTPEESHAAPEASRVPASEGLRLLAVHAHPDDESSKGAAMMAAYSAAGAEVMVATCTGGEAGSLLNPNYGDETRLRRDMTGVRRSEMSEAGEALGVEHRWLGFVDSGLPEGDPMPELPAGTFATLPLEQATAPLVRLVREFRPHVIISYDEIGGYPHPDHVQSHEVTVAAYQDAGDPEKYPGTGEAWEISKLYYDRAFNLDKYRALHQAFLEAGQDSPYGKRIAWFEKMQAEASEKEEASNNGRPRFTRHPVTTQVPVADFLERRDAALRAHRTQIDPQGHFFAAPNDLIRTTWPWEDYVLIDSRVRAELPEVDLFAGLRTQQPGKTA